MATFLYAAMREYCVYSRGLQSSHNRVSLEEMCVDFRILVNLHFLQIISIKVYIFSLRTYHLEGVELLFDLLSKHRRQAVAGCNLTPTVILSTRPGVVELDSRAEGSISFTDRALRGARNAL